MCLSLLTDPNQNYSIWSACAENNRFKFEKDPHITRSDTADKVLCSSYMACIIHQSNQNYTNCSSCAECNVYNILERSLYYKAWYSGESSLFKYCALYVLTHPKQNYNICTACSESNYWNVLESSLHYTAWYSGEGNLFMLCAIHYWPIPPNIILFVTHAHRVKGVMF
jgi:hypothetical protein